MSKLQMIKRANSSVSYSANIPLAMIRDLNWNKGDILNFAIIDDKLVILKSEVENEGN